MFFIITVICVVQIVHHHKMFNHASLEVTYQMYCLSEYSPSLKCIVCWKPRSILTILYNVPSTIHLLNCSRILPFFQLYRGVHFLLHSIRVIEDAVPRDLLGLRYIIT